MYDSQSVNTSAPVIATGPSIPQASTIVQMNPLSTVYATKRRRRNGKSLKPPTKDSVTKSNPSKRHRERLNAELDTLANLLPFEPNILSKLDRLSILRLSVSYLRTKSYFQVTMCNSKDESIPYRARSELGIYEHVPVDGDMFLQALNGFLVILTCEGEVFFATHTIESYLGFHQSDIVHQSVYELVHSEDREELQRQLMWNSFLPSEQSGISLQEAVQAENNHLLERSFTVRFRCLLDNTSGFLRLDIRGRVKILHGQNRKTEEPPLALFAICTPFGPPSLLEIPHKEVMFKSKHKLDFCLVSMDQRGKLLLGYSDSELANMGGYDLVHYDDLAYVASAHQELLKTGASGMIAYRYQTKDGNWQWLQTSSRLVYKNSKPDFVLCTHRPLMEEEGRDLIGKRTMDFKVSYLDAGLTNSYFTDSDQLLAPSSTISYNHPSASSSSLSLQTSSNHTKSSGTPQKVNRRYKTQLRDFLSTCRTKRKLTNHPSTTPIVHPTPTSVATAVDYITGSVADPMAVAYSNLYANPYPPTNTNPVDPYGSSNFHQPLYDNRIPYLTTTDNLFHQYRPLTNYYPEYHPAPPGTSYVSNGFLEIPPPARTSPSSLTPLYDTTMISITDNNKLNDCNRIYSCHQQSSIDPKSYGGAIISADNLISAATPPYVSPIMPPSTPCTADVQSPRSAISIGRSPIVATPTESVNGLHSMKFELDVKSEGFQHYSPLPPSEPARQTVLMWALNHTPQSSISSSGRSPTDDIGSNAGTPPVLLNGPSAQYVPRDVKKSSSSSYLLSSSSSDPLKSLAEMNSMPVTKWKPDTPPSPKTSSSYYHHQYAHEGPAPPPPEVWPAHAHHQFYPYHHHHHHHTAVVSTTGMAGECRYPSQINRTGVLCCPSQR